MNQDCISRAGLRKRVIESRDKIKAQGNLPLPSGYAACLELIDEAPTLTADDYFDAVDRIKPCPNCRYTLLGALTENEPRWIPVTERLPEKNGNYIVTACDEGCSYGEGIWYSTVVVVAEYYNGAWTWYEGSAEYDLEGIVTHWMPLPEAPKED